MTGVPDVPAPGWVVWITGLAGAGKTSLARALVTHMRALPRSVLLLDGDELRQAFDGELGYTLDERRRAAMRYARLARLVAAQGLDVVVATISMFHDCRTWNRRHLARYYEVYLRASPATLAARTRARAPASSALVVGRDLPWEEPESADLTVDTDAFVDQAAVARHVWTALRRVFPEATGAHELGLH